MTKDLNVQKSIYNKFICFRRIIQNLTKENTITILQYKICICKITIQCDHYFEQEMVQ